MAEAKRQQRRTNGTACEEHSVALSHATFFGVARVSSGSTKSGFARMRVPMPRESRWRTEGTPREWAFIVAVAYGGSRRLNKPWLSRTIAFSSVLCNFVGDLEKGGEANVVSLSVSETSLSFLGINGRIESKLRRENIERLFGGFFAKLCSRNIPRAVVAAGVFRIR